MVNKKGQVTIFIIIALILIASVSLFFVLRNGIGTEDYASPETGDVYNFVQLCIEEVSAEVIYEVADNGGYYFPPNFSTASGVPYYFSEGKNYMPTKAEVENEISYFIQEKLFFCTLNFIHFPDLKITQSPIKVETEITEESVIIDVEYPISVTKGESTDFIKNFDNVEIPVRLGTIYNSVEKIIQDQLKDPNICLSCILDISLENDLYVEMVDYDEKTVIFIIRDEHSKINNETLTYSFASEY